jgi:hypothetical protein
VRRTNATLRAAHSSRRRYLADELLSAAHPSFRAAAFLVFLFGCTASLTDAPYVSGSWGSEDFDLTAGPKSVVLNSGCYVVDFPLRSPLVDGDSFAVVGTVTSSTWDLQVGQQWRLNGVARSDTVVATVSFLPVQTPYAATDSAWLSPVAVTFAGPPRTDRIHECQT